MGLLVSGYKLYINVLIKNFNQAMSTLVLSVWQVGLHGNSVYGCIFLPKEKNVCINGLNWT